MESQQGFAGGTYTSRPRSSVINCKDTRFTTARAGRRGSARVRLEQNFQTFLDFAYPGGFQLKGGVAVVANVVEAALGLAGVDYIPRRAMRALCREGRELHGVLSIAQRSWACQARAAEFQGRVKASREAPHCGSAAPLCGKALPFRGFPLRISPSARPEGLAFRPSGGNMGRRVRRKATGFPHSGAAEPLFPTLTQPWV